jgi:hypothetical protein
MQKQIFSVFDSKSKVFSTPFFSHNINTALRDFAHASNDKSTDLYRYSTDYTLFHIGSFDEDSGIINSFNPVSLGLAVSFINQEVIHDV